MRLRKIALRGLVRFTSAQPVIVDLDQLGPGLVALTGENGEGKTTIVEAVTAALYKALPSRDSWYDYWHGRDGFVETIFEDRGHELKARVLVDAEARKTEPYLFVDGESSTTGRAREFDDRIRAHFGSYELFLASVLGAQRRTGNFLDSVKGERKARFVELLGLAHLERLHEQAKVERVEAESALTHARAALGAVQAQAAMLPEQEAAAAEGQRRADAAAHTLEAARTGEASAIVAVERAKGAQERLATLEAGVRAADRALGDARQALATAVDAEPRARRAAEQRRKGLAQQDPAALIERANERHQAARVSIDRRREALEATLHERPALEAARKRAEDLAQEAAGLEAAERELTRAGADVRVAEGAVAGVERRVTDAENHLIDEQTRMADEAKLLERVPCTAADLWIKDPDAPDGIEDLAGTCPLLGAARKAKEQGPKLKVDAALLEALKSAQETEAAARERATVALIGADPVRLTAIRDELRELQRQAARLPAVDQARRDLQALATDLEHASDDRSRAIKDAEDLRNRLETERVVIELELEAAIADARRQVTSAQQRLDEAAAEAETVRKALATARAENAALSLPQAEASLSAARATRYEADKALRSADQALAGANAKLEQLREKLADLPVLEAAARAAEQELGDWALLAQALGRDGIQALEIDAAGPEVARLCNELLEACYGTRWTIAFETLREKRSGDGYVEAFDIRVFDRGQERAVEGISGGERVIVGEALALALAIYNARKSGVRWETLFRDETSGALSLANAQAYADMLRRALALGGFHQVVFISHQPEVVERADVRLVVAGGRVTVEGAPAPPVPAGATA